jgi:hypothetical protein
LVERLAQENLGRVPTLAVPVEIPQVAGAIVRFDPVVENAVRDSIPVVDNLARRLIEERPRLARLGGLNVYS